jgi:hypothetical protein
MGDDSQVPVGGELRLVGAGTIDRKAEALARTEAESVGTDRTATPARIRTMLAIAAPPEILDWPSEGSGTAHRLGVVEMERDDQLRADEQFNIRLPGIHQSSPR